MRSLFWKIFVAFLSTVLIIELGTAWGMAMLHQSEIHPVLENENHVFVKWSHDARDVLVLQGLAEFTNWREIDPPPSAVEDVFILNEQGRDISGRKLPERVINYLKENVEDVAVPEHSHPVEYVLKSDITTPQGEKYLLVTTFRSPSLLAFLLTSQRVALGVLVSALICFVLARYFTQPIVRLRQTTQVLASGRLDTRAPETLCRRSDEFGELARDFDHMADRLNHLVSTQKQMLRDISHELRSPLARIQVALELARNEGPARTEVELDRIDAEVDRLNALIDQLLKFVRLTSANQVLEKGPVRIAELLTNIVQDASYEHSGGARGDAIELEWCDDAVLDANEPLLYSAIENVLRNACYYTPPTEKIRINCTATPDVVTVRIEDRGPGIPDEMLAKVFEPFVRVSSAREQGGGGYGIGLAIAKRAIDVHGGSITAKNNGSTAGLTVTITLPTNQCKLANVA